MPLRGVQKCRPGFSAGRCVRSWYLGARTARVRSKKESSLECDRTHSRSAVRPARVHRIASDIRRSPGPPPRLRHSGHPSDPSV